jgi:rusticyanin
MPALAIILVVIGLGSLAVSLAYVAYDAMPYRGSALPPVYSQGMMNQGMGMMGNGMMGEGMMNTQISSIDNATFNHINALQNGVTVDKATNTVSINSPGVTLPIEAAPLWYPQSGEYWLIYGLVNPKILVKQGMQVNFLFINMDNEFHVPAITTMPPPYPYMPMMSGMMGGNYQFKVGAMLPGVASSTSGGNPVYSDSTLSVSFSTTGTYWYVCLYQDHAQMGMYGEIQVVS